MFSAGRSQRNVSSTSRKKVARLERVQRDVVRCLHESDFSSEDYQGLARCQFDRCGCPTCLEVCAFGAHRRQLAAKRAIRRLLGNAGQDAFEARMLRDVWERPSGRLDELSIPAAAKLIRRSLDRLYRRRIIAIGAFKVRWDLCDPRWVAEVQLVGTGASKDQIEQTLSLRRHDKGREAHVWVAEVQDLRQAVARLFQDAICPVDEGLKLKKAVRREYYAWLAKLPPGARLIRYGCDRHFNELNKRTRAPTELKNRSFPYWLEPYWFGTNR